MNQERWQKIYKSCDALLIWGASDQCRVNYQILKSLDFKLVALVDDTPNKISPFTEVPIYFGRQGLNIFLDKNRFDNLGFIIAIGNPFGRMRLELHNYLKSKKLLPVSFSDPSALICKTASYGEGLQVMPSAVIQNEVIIGDQCIINTRALVEHDCILNNGVEIGPGAVLCGRVTVGENTWIGANATIRPRINIGSNSIIGAGAVVVKDIPDNVVVTGVPAKVLKENPYV